MNLVRGEPVHLASHPGRMIVSRYGLRMPDGRAADSGGLCRDRPTRGVDGLPEEVDRLIRGLVTELGAKVVAAVSSRAPMHACSGPHRREAADHLQWLRASAHVRQSVAFWADHYECVIAERAVLRGATHAELGHALGIDRSTVTKRWPQLSRISAARRWFEAHAADWARALTALGNVADEVQMSGYRVETAVSVAVTAARVFDAEGQWYDMAGSVALDCVRVLAEDEDVRGTTGRARLALQDVGVVWRAFVAGRGVQAQLRTERRVGPRERMRTSNVAEG